MNWTKSTLPPERIAEAPGGLARATLSRLSELVADLEARLSYAETDRQDLAQRLVSAESQASHLTNLYVATYQLHTTLDLEAVKATIADISINLLGAEAFLLLLTDGSTPGHEITMQEGKVEAATRHCVQGAYLGGEPLIDEALEKSAPCFGPTASSPLIAAIPLRSQGQVVGVLVVGKVLDHHASRIDEDRELLDLLAAHAASALLAARAYESRDRKVKTLESLVRLVRSTVAQESR